MPLSDTPTEILLLISQYLEYECDLNAFSQTCRRIYILLNHQLYQRHLKDLPSPALEWSAKHGKIACVQNLLDAGVPPETAYGEPWQPIVLAAGNGHADVVKVFLEHGVDPDRPNGFANMLDPEPLGPSPTLGNPLSAAAEHGHESVVSLLIEHRVTLQMPVGECVPMSRGRGAAMQSLSLAVQPLSLAIHGQHIPVIKLLLENGCDLNAIDPCFGNPMNQAAQTSLDIVRLLFNAGASLHGRRSSYVEPPIFSALYGGNIPIVEFLLDNGVNFDSIGGIEHAFYETVLKNNHDVALMLLGRIDENSLKIESREEDDMIMGAATGGFEDLMKRLLKNYHGISLMAHPTHCPFVRALSAAAEAGHIGIVELLLDHGVDPNHLLRRHRVIPKDDEFTEHGCSICFEDNRWSDNPVMSAAMEGHHGVVKLLLDRGADPDFLEALTVTDSFYAVLKGGHSDIVQLLLEHDPALPTKDPDIESISWIREAVEGGAAVLRVLLQHGILELQPGNIEQQRELVGAARRGVTDILEIFLDAGFDVNSRAQGTVAGAPTLLQLAATAPSTAAEAVSFLLERGADIEARDPVTDFTPLFGLIWSHGFGFGCNKHVPKQVSVRGERGIKLLLEKGADALRTDKYDDTALIFAARTGQRRFVKLLLEWFELRQIPFDAVKDQVLLATSTTHPDVAQVLWRYYWRKVYPPGMS